MVKGYNGLHSHSDILQNLSEHVTVQGYARRLALPHMQERSHMQPAKGIRIF